MLTVPVAVIGFRRPALAARLLERIRQVRPQELFVILDGPRRGHPDDAPRCAAVREAFERVDWPCRVRTNASPVNLGPDERVRTGLTWTFDLVEEAIVLEEDCMPGASFFPYARELLARYRGTPEIAMIAGCNPLGRWQEARQSYHCSRYASHWGWATWRRAWRRFGVAADGRTPKEWDLRWVSLQVAARALCVIPAVNLVTNEGFGADSSHTFLPLDPGSRIPVGEMAFPLVPPPSLEADEDFDTRYLAWCSGEPRPEWVAESAEQALQAGQSARAFLRAAAALQRAGETDRDAIARLERVKARALAAMRSKEARRP